MTEVTDDNGDLVERYEYDVYGNVSIFDGSYTPRNDSLIGNPYLFTGRRYDGETGNYYYRARYYSPYLNRWTQPDSIIPDFTNPQSLNRYSYVYNRPVTPNSLTAGQLAKINN